MNNPLINDVLSWNRFYDKSLQEKSYPPKKIELFNRLIAHTNNLLENNP